MLFCNFLTYRQLLQRQHRLLQQREVRELDSVDGAVLSPGPTSGILAGAVGGAVAHVHVRHGEAGFGAGLPREKGRL